MKKKTRNLIGSLVKCGFATCMIMTSCALWAHLFCKMVRFYPEMLPGMSGIDSFEKAFVVSLMLSSTIVLFMSSVSYAWACWSFLAKRDG